MPDTDWVVPLWWVLVPGQTIVSGDQLIDRWYGRMAKPKPAKNACVPEIAGWSGMLGARAWVALKYEARVAELARGGGYRRRPLNEPDSWNGVSRLYADYADALARFSAEFAALVAAMRPDGLPNDDYDWVRELKNRVPRLVRHVMVSPVDGPHGDVIESPQTILCFFDTSKAQLPSYESIARRGYLAVLVDRLERLRDAENPNPETISVFEAAIAMHAAEYGDPEEPVRKATAEERELVHAVLTAEVDAQPSLRKNPLLGEAYKRATQTLLRRMMLGSRNIDGRALFSALRWARLDSMRVDQRTRAWEAHVADEHLPLRIVGGIAGDNAQIAAQLLLSRAHTELMAYAEPHAPGDSWEKSLALRLLSQGNAIAFAAFGGLAELVTAAWEDAAPEYGSRPPGACTYDAQTAARYVQSLLKLTAATAKPSPGPTIRRYARRLQQVHDEIAAQRAAMDGEERPS
ncbi:hypothetical protein GFY24_30340 [Nocardia sp. SYP-A9097]|uniref:hypothetical protein n=1 Tax=Nocardia sp. SYP-A9097 TaxID=2663237 RepID=UPI00129A22E7|nr:hypothetical protein [Nocardia sp. SYP-A9097]MRH91690.1 hypothetical protein [Nocardia sp. SYP-A9097]